MYKLKDCGVEGFFGQTAHKGNAKMVKSSTIQSLLSSSGPQSLLKSLPKITFLFPTCILQNEYLCAESRFLSF